MFLVLAAQFESFIHPLIIMLSVPLAVTGALLSLWLTGNSLNIYSQIGIILLIGLMAKNGILIVEFANQLRDEGRSIREAVLEASVLRLRPIVMTVLSTMLGAVPLVLATGAGAESRARDRHRGDRRPRHRLAADPVRHAGAVRPAGPLHPADQRGREGARAGPCGARRAARRIAGAVSEPWFEPPRAEPPTGENVAEYSVSELAAALKRTLEDGYGYVRVRGEISGFKRAGSGHLYFALKDDGRGARCGLLAQHGAAPRQPARGRARGGRDRPDHHLSQPLALPADRRSPGSRPASAP